MPPKNNTIGKVTTHLPTPSPEVEAKAEQGSKDAVTSSQVEVKAEQGSEDAETSSKVEVKAEQGSKDAETSSEVQKEIARILKCSNSPAEILAVETNASEKAKVDSWMRLGCLVHEKQCNTKVAKAAFTSK